jgi:O-antigen ligase
MRITLPGRCRDTAPLQSAAAGFLLLALLAAVLSPPGFWLLLAAATAAAILFLAYRHLEAVTAAWLLVAGATLEMTLGDMLGLDAYQPIIAAVKAVGLGLALLAVLRYGPRLDPWNPAYAWLAMFAAGLAHGLYPALSTGDSVRSLIGSAAPFAFCFSRLSRRWARAIIRMTAWIPLLTVTAGALLDAGGVRPLFINSGGLRLAGLGHPAFLAGFCLTAIYAGLIELFRDGRPSRLWLLAANAVLLLLTGARAPLFYAAAVSLLSLLFVPSAALSPRLRVLLLLGGATALPVLAALAGDLADIRAINLLLTAPADLSGRQELWPSFEQAAALSPWWGWGVGAGNAIIPPESPLVQSLHTWAAHNEYLRVAVEGGQCGRALLVACFVLWVRGHTARLVPSDRAIMRLVFTAFAFHALTDNVLISTSACVLFAFATAVFARGQHEQSRAERDAPAARAVQQNAA